jgi:hypothetical protein
MGTSNALGVATDIGLRIFDSRMKVGEIFGVIMFDDYVDERILAQTVVDESLRRPFEMIYVSLAHRPFPCRKHQVWMSRRSH